MSSFKAFLESQGKSKSTIMHYQRYVLDFITWLDTDNTEIENTTAKEVMSYLNYLQKKGLSNKTRGIRLAAFNHFFDYQIEKELRTEHPTKHIKIRGANTKKLTPILSREDLEKIYLDYEIPTAQDPRKMKNWFTTYKLSKQRNHAILSLLINQGLTTAEMSRLQIKDLRLKEGEIYVQGSRKSNERTLTLKSNQIMDLMEYIYQVRPELLKYYTTEQTTLFLSTPTAGLKNVEKNTLCVWKRLTEEIKEKHPKFINLRQIRTSVITHWLKQHNLREVQYMAGHRYVSTTEGYLVNQVEDLQADIDKFHPLS